MFKLDLASVSMYVEVGGRGCVSRLLGLVLCKKLGMIDRSSWVYDETMCAGNGSVAGMIDWHSGDSYTTDWRWGGRREGSCHPPPTLPACFARACIPRSIHRLPNSSHSPIEAVTVNEPCVDAGRLHPSRPSFQAHLAASLIRGGVNEAD